MFLGLERHSASSPAAFDENGRELTYGQLRAAAAEAAAALPRRSLVFAFCENSFGALIGYVSFLTYGAVPLLLDRHLNPALARRLIETYRPAALWLPGDMPAPVEGPLLAEAAGYRLTATGLPPFPLHNDLALLITTSGSTGSPKLVRQSLKNLESNAAAIVRYLELNPAERPVTSLPMNYVYGLSVVNSHLAAGAALLLTNRSLMQKEFWTFFREGGATSIAGVPYTYEMLKKLRFFRMNLPSLRTMTQAGGKLQPELHLEFARYAADSGRRFVVMYGAAEATARMGYLPPDKAVEKCGSMGLAIDGGRFSLIDEAGREISEAGLTGELVYYGDNVTLGYAERGEDLIKGDERRGRLETGDLARRDEDGFYYVTGRKKRFLKLFGNRVGLDETESLIKSRFPGLECACAGRDDLMYIFVADQTVAGEITAFVAETLRINQAAFRLKPLACLPKNESGKTLYAALEDYYDQ
ncbi:MAG: AMP-binding protein [Candidatus Adiutrix sp.]|jgi:acyl-coenzyme A synthetase/AMP-(fatty) acid ligase|nr:AMP-binding protein [Candidatus Adiutrix sp.]